MSTRPNEINVNERATAVRAASPQSSSFNPVGDLNLRLNARLAISDEELMIDPRSRVEVIVQTSSQALGYAAPIATLVLLFVALSGNF